MDTQQIASLSSAMSQWQVRNEVNVTMLRKTLDQQANNVSTLMQSASVPAALPANPAIGRNINTTA
ncbi:YjfB family protein [Erwinia psidii]|uniref:Putative motility protein n=1 Tax=Erwinia psidii TaxID=69224 RepID=A0A3N6RZ01_9GAMM|nr:YjfB family protein [Erwinia psidii]MCX8955843.1 putative motility protein [Erwinia psidii]MCX8961601.1 putative motility protein [Erwinia psidii]MCX8965700.1 putative motility protein [Erwinia psidii]RQM37677.1 putative motility protein [Erwinia psidii]